MEEGVCLGFEGASLLAELSPASGRGGGHDGGLIDVSSQLLEYGVKDSRGGVCWKSNYRRGSQG